MLNEGLTVWCADAYYLIHMKMAGMGGGWRRRGQKYLLPTMYRHFYTCYGAKVHIGSHSTGFYNQIMMNMTLSQYLLYYNYN